MQIFWAFATLVSFIPGFGTEAQDAQREIKLAASHPANDAFNVAVDASIHLRFSDAINPDTLNAITIAPDRANAAPIVIRRSTDLTNASITLVARDLLEPNTRYRVTASDKLRSKTGQTCARFSFVFTTAAETRRGGNGLEFTAQRFDTTRSTTTILFGPDRRLYAASAFGELVCWDVNEAGKPSNRTVLFKDETTSRQFIDLEWDPAASTENLLLWVSYAERLRKKSDARYYFTGEVARYEIVGSKVVEKRVFVTGLPHGREVQGGHETLPHQPNGLCFHNGKLYQSVGSTSSSGGPPNWGIKEQPLSACVIEIDYKTLEQQTAPFEVSPLNSDFDPVAADAPVRRFATGIRNALEIIAHSNGRLYTAVNMNDRGSRSDGVPDDPDIPGDQNKLIKQITPNHESLYILKRGRHYGLPNPSIGNYVLAGGNPTADKDPFEITDYPVGTRPEPGYAPELMYPIWRWGGTSPNGMIEYRPGFDHPLSGAILCCFYSANDIAAMRLGDDGLPVRIDKLRSPKGKLQFTGPLDITQDPKTGNLYVADFGKQSKFGSDGSLVWLRPVKR